MSLKHIMQHIEASPNITHYALIACEWSSKTGAARCASPSPAATAHDFIVLNVDLTQERAVQPEPVSPAPTMAISSAHSPRALAQPHPLAQPTVPGPLQGAALLLEDPCSFLALQAFPPMTLAWPLAFSPHGFFFLVFLLHNFRGDGIKPFNFLHQFTRYRI